jgi:hypothetical protein
MSSLLDGGSLLTKGFQVESYIEDNGFNHHQLSGLLQAVHLADIEGQAREVGMGYVEDNGLSHHQLPGLLQAAHPADTEGQAQEVRMGLVMKMKMTMMRPRFKLQSPKA